MKNLLISLFFIPLSGMSQITHTVAAKETLYSLGRQYQIHPKELANYNKISIETGLTIGQVLKIPSKGNIPPQSTQAAPAKTEIVTREKEAIQQGSVPVFHKVQKKETLYQISKMYNGVAVADLKKWNNLSGDGLSEGINLIVGYQGNEKASATFEKTPKKDMSEILKKTDIPETKPGLLEQAEPEKKESLLIVNKPELVKNESQNIPGNSLGGGFFKNLYITQTAGKKDLKEETGIAATFKSTSGWQDGKYYCLYNNAPSGTIVRITHKNTQKSIYAKVLDIIPDLKQNAGVLIRVGNAAADELGGGPDNFEAVINF